MYLPGWFLCGFTSRKSCMQICAVTTRVRCSTNDTDKQMLVLVAGLFFAYLVCCACWLSNPSLISPSITMCECATGSPAAKIVKRAKQQRDHKAVHYDMEAWVKHNRGSLCVSVCDGLGFAHCHSQVSLVYRQVSQHSE